jgi:hypothetical protein
VVMREPVPQPEVSTATFSALHEEAARPAPPPMSAPAPVARLAAAPKAESAQVTGSMADEPAVKRSKRAPVALLSLEEALQVIVQLREEGNTKAADQQLLELHRRFPDEDLPARLEALKR